MSDHAGSGTPPPRIATLVLVDHTGQLRAELPPLQVDLPWWPDAVALLQAVQARHGIRPTLLRLLQASLPAPPGGEVHYLAEWSGPLPPDSVPGAALADRARLLAPHPQRQAWARPGGPAADLAWAAQVLADRGLALAGPAEQVKSWNLSSLWRLPLGSTSNAAGAPARAADPGACAWLKVVPDFFAHEGALLQALQADDAQAPVPRLLGRQGARLLLAPVPGQDLYEAPLAQRLAMIDLLVRLQRRWQGRVDELRALGLPDWRGPALETALAGLVQRCGGALPAASRRLLDGFIHQLPTRLAAVAACGLPDGLVHGDFHPGNLRGPAEPASAADAAPLVLLDWADSGVGHPLLDQPAFLSRLGPAEAETARRHWAQAWQRHLPGAEVARAARLLAPVAAARQALIYQGFLDRIEPAEHPYHRDDVPHWLRQTAALVEAGAGD